jgi:hypothetical protein
MGRSGGEDDEFVKLGHVSEEKVDSRSFRSSPAMFWCPLKFCQGVIHVHDERVIAMIGFWQWIRKQFCVDRFTVCLPNACEC